MPAIHMVAFLWMLATGVILSILARKLGGKSAALLTLLFYLTFTAALYPKMIAANSEIFMALPYSMAVLLLWYAMRPRKGDACFLSRDSCPGWLCSSSRWPAWKSWRYLFISSLIIPLLYGKKRILASVAACAKYGAGFVLPIGAVAFLFYIKGILSDQIFWNITYPSRYISLGVSNQSFMSQILVEFVPFVLSTIILWVLSCVWMKHVVADFRNQRKSFSSHFSLFLVLWLAASMYAAFLGNRMYGHYFIQILPPLSLMAALAAAKYVDEKSESRSRHWKAAILALTAIPGIVFTGMRSD